MSIYALVTVLLKHVGLLGLGAFVLLAISPVQELNFKRNTLSNTLFLILFFGLFGIIGTYSGNAMPRDSPISFPFSWNWKTSR